MGPTAGPLAWFTRTVLQVEQPPAEVAAAIGVAPAKRKRRRKNGRSCEDCFFHNHMLCALALDEPCSTFRADGPRGLTPPRQPALLLRQSESQPPPESA
jgi:hypothetical protein